MGNDSHAQSIHECRVRLVSNSSVEDHMRGGVLVAAQGFPPSYNQSRNPGSLWPVLKTSTKIIRN
jgi:hypothetical protein